jgi:hypothetical protein
MTRPAPLILIAVWQIIDAALALLSISFIFVYAVMIPELVQEMGDTFTGYSPDMPSLNTIIWWTAIFGIIINLIFLGISLAGGIGILRFKEWGRIISIIHSGIVVFIGVITTALMALMMIIISYDIGSLDTAGASYYTVIIALILFPLVGVVIGILSLFYLTRRQTRALFKPVNAQAVPQSVSNETK